jgi:hypothetical protein
MFGDNESVVKSGSIPHSRLNKRHQALSYHAVREAIASGMLSFTHIPGPINSADILSKHWGYQQVWPTLKPIMFWKGDTADLFVEDEDSNKKKGSNTNSTFTSPNISQEGQEVQSTNDGTNGSVIRSHNENLLNDSMTENPKDMTTNATTKDMKDTTTNGHTTTSTTESV